MAIHPLTVQGREANKRFVLGAGKKTVDSFGTVDLSAVELTPSVLNQMRGLLAAGKITVTTAEGTALTTTTFDAMFGATLPNRTQVPGSFAQSSSAESERNVVNAGYDLAASTSSAANNAIANHIINIGIGSARVGGVWAHHITGSATANYRQDYSCGTNGKKKNGSTAAAVLSGASKGYFVHAILISATDDTLVGLDGGSNFNIPSFIYGDEATNGSEVALTTAQLEAAAATICTAAGKTLKNILIMGRFLARTAGNSAFTISSITNTRPVI